MRAPEHLAEMRPAILIVGTEASRHTGVGLIQRQLAFHLASVLENRYRVDHFDIHRSVISRATARPSDDYVATVWTHPPSPLFRPSGLYCHFVHDLRWKATRGTLARAYRRADLHRTGRQADVIFTISEYSKSQIEKEIGTRIPVVVVPMGPGQIKTGSALPAVNTRTICMVGSAAHKRNELLARTLVQSSLVRDQFRIVLINTSDEVRDLLRPLGRSVTATQSTTSEVFGRILREASVFISLAVDEGFGLPFVEAAACGCDVIAIRTPLTEEVLGESAVFVDAVAPSVADLEHALYAWDATRVQRLRDLATARDWLSTANVIAEYITSKIS